MKKKKLYESQKNYLVCAILMLIVGVLMFPVGEEKWAIGCIAIGVLFLIGFFVLLKKEGLCEVDEDEEEPAVKKTVKEENDEKQAVKEEKLDEENKEEVKGVS